MIMEKGNDMVLELNGKPILWLNEPIVFADKLEIIRDDIPHHDYTPDGVTNISFEGKLIFVPQTPFQKAHKEWFQKNIFLSLTSFDIPKNRRKNRTKILDWQRNHRNNKNKRK